MKSLGQSVGAITAPLFQKKYIKLGRLIQSWADIVGADMAAQCTPCALKYRKSKGKVSSATLHVSASSAQAMFIHYRKGIMLERIAMVLGENIIEDIKIIHSAVDKPVHNPKKDIKTLTDAQKKDLSAIVQSVENDALKKSLERLGQSILEANHN